MIKIVLMIPVVILMWMVVGCMAYVIIKEIIKNWKGRTK